MIGQTISHYRIVERVGNGVIVAYKQTHVGTEHGKPFAVHIYTHSNWQRREDKWVLTMYQDSTAKEDE